MINLINFILTGLAFIAIVLAVIIDFFDNHSNKDTRKEKRSFVETGTMFIFFILFYLAIRLGFGKLNFETNTFIWIISAICWCVLILGIYFNVAGRFYLGKNWANQIKIYKSHNLVTEGTYRTVRHPLYASLIWIFYACSILYFNWVAFLLNTFIFIPMMYYRAKQEERLLSEQFKNYKDYSRKVGMFFPKIF